ncbi:Putative mitochondrial import inner membrane translocase subunit Tim17 family protein [Zea mays]|uniref:Putative mitochondrial import inner membrane translocase subunit Tim17 family protein n=1 Tax=Zea mays TaxID=4577 RepID=A0A1D6FVP8_MAIZE|nr:Putative mitochondrial import inner membrane translocase subunit Tim17 family protein [Zea mays]
MAWRGSVGAVTGRTRWSEAPCPARWSPPPAATTETRSSRTPSPPAPSQRPSSSPTTSPS